MAAARAAVGTDAPQDRLDVATTLLFRDLPAQDTFDEVGLGEDGAMLFPLTGNIQLFKDWELIRRLL